MRRQKRLDISITKLFETSNEKMLDCHLEKLLVKKKNKKITFFFFAVSAVFSNPKSIIVTSIRYGVSTEKYIDV